MTKKRAFKQAVRARMQRTGERYAAARAQLAAEPAGKPGAHPETAALARVLAAAGIAGPDGAPVTEALVLGLGGGIGAAAFAFEYKGHTPTFYIATRCQPQYAYDAAFVRTAAERLGAACKVTETTSAAVATKQLRAQLAAGPAIAWVDLGALPWSVRIGPAAELGAMPHVVVIESLADDVALVHDRQAAPWQLALPELATARKRLRNAKHRLVTVARGASTDPARAVIDAIAACAAELRGKTKIRGAMSANFGIGGLRRWATALAADKDPKRWTKVFPAEHAAGTLAWARYWIEHAGTGGGAFRPLYAEFLDDAAAIAKRPALRAVATRYRGLGDEWSALATAMLPASIAPLDAIRKLQDARAAAFVRGDLDGLRGHEERLARALGDARTTPPLAGDALRAHYTALAARVTAIADAEEAAAMALAAAID